MDQPNPYESPRATRITPRQTENFSRRVLRFLKVAIFTGTAFGLFFSLIFVSIRTLLFGMPGPGLHGFLFVAVPTAICFGIAMAAFAEWQASRFARNDPGLGDERIVKQGPASHFRRREARGGWLYLTDLQLLFQSHGFNLQNEELSIPLDQVLGVELCATLGIVPNGLRVLTRRGAERFVVQGRRSWVEAIRRQRGGEPAAKAE
jgi:hypothetical protein